MCQGTTKLININIGQWIEKLGRDTFVTILRMLVGLNRIYALWNLTAQTGVSEEEKNKARSYRNRSVSYILINGVLHELYQILQTLAGDMRERSSRVHEKIVEILSIFDGNPLRNMLTEFRNSIAFHIGKDTVSAGLEVVQSDSITLVRSDSDTYRDIYYSFAENNILRGFFRFFRKKFAETDESDFETFYQEKFKQFALYNLEIQTTLVKKFDELLDMMVDEFELEIEESQQENRSDGD